MPEGEDILPTPESSSAPTDTEVAQNWFDEWSASIEEKINHLQEAITHVAQSQKASIPSGPAPTQPSHPPATAAPEGRGSAPPSVSEARQPQLQATESVTVQQPERAPQPGHWYFKRIWGNR